MVKLSGYRGRGHDLRSAAAPVAICAAAWLTACTNEPSVQDDLAGIAEFNRLYVQAINDGDIDALALLTTDDHIMLMPNRPPLIGKEANIEAMARVFEQSEIDETWVPEETVVAGDWAYQRGTFTVGFRPKGDGGELRLTTGNFLRIYNRQPDGEWRMTRDVFNTYEPQEN